MGNNRLSDGDTASADQTSGIKQGHTSEEYALSLQTRC